MLLQKIIGIMIITLLIILLIYIVVKNVYEACGYLITKFMRNEKEIEKEIETSSDLDPNWSELVER